MNVASPTIVRICGKSKCALLQLALTIEPGTGPDKATKMHRLKNSRADRIRTCDFYVPNVALYQAELQPVFCKLIGDLLVVNTKSDT